MVLLDIPRSVGIAAVLLDMLRSVDKHFNFFNSELPCVFILAKGGFIGHT